MLRDLVSSGQIGVEVVFPIKGGPSLNACVERNSSSYTELNTSRIQPLVCRVNVVTF